jgi:ketol-acid reductoisomerase
MSNGITKGITNGITNINKCIKLLGYRTLKSNIFNIEKLKINNTTENIIRGGKENYHLLNRGFSNIKQIGIIGWGSQAPSQVQNLNDTLRSINSDIKIKVGLRENSSSWKKVINTQGLSSDNVGEISKVLHESDMNIILISDYAQATNYDFIFKHIRPNTTLGFSHGFLLGHLDNIGISFPKDINVVMMAPKGMGPSLRKCYLQNSGINSSISVYQDIDGTALDKVLSWGIGVGSPYIFETSMKEEYISDLFGERAILLGGIHGIVEYLFRDFIIKLTHPEKAFVMSVKNLTSVINEKISKDGLLQLYIDLNECDKQEFRTYYSKSYNICKELFTEIYDEVNYGNEIRSVILNGNRYFKKIDNSYMWKIGNNLYKNNFEEYSKSNLNLNSDDSKSTYYLKNNICAKTAGIYIGGMMAQIDILLNNGHSYSEIVNESIIEATDSLNPYMDERGIAHMIDNCSTTARLGARKWAPRLDYLLQQNMDLSLKKDDESEIINKFTNHKIHTAIKTLYKFKV